MSNVDCDVIVIGAGVVGLAVAAELASSGRSVYLLEKERTHGQGISSRNSEVIHAGLYYPPGSLKAKLCVEGRELLYEACARFGVPHRKLGKLVVAVSQDELGPLEALQRNAAACGVTSLVPLDAAAVRRLEPQIRAVAGFFSPETGIVSAHELMELYLAQARASGAQIAYGTEVVGVEPLAAGYRVETRGEDGERFGLRGEAVVNAAGLSSDTVARMVGVDYRLHYCKGSYFSVRNVKRGTVSRLVYPVPEERHVGLGVHLTLDLGGRMRLGPDAEYIDRVEDYRVDASKAERFYEAASRYLPFLSREDIAPDTAGIRPKLQGSRDDVRDFVISMDLPGFVNLVGIESPGLTAAPAIARRVRQLLA
jgi:L-2-hydroxyglutarate oxidase LhgO